jgi:hypothetical protein
MPDLFDIDDGILGIEALWTWNGWLWTDRQADEHVHLIKLVGPHDGPDHADPRAPKIGRIGERAFPTSSLGVTYVFEGEARAKTLPGLRAFGTMLRAAFADVRSEGEMSVQAHADLGGPAGVFHARRMPGGLQMPDRQGTVRWSRPFTLGLRLSDPRVYFPALAVDVTGSPAAVTNVGTAPADPLLTLAGAAGDVVVTDGTRTLTFVDVPAGTMVIDFAARTAKVGAVHCKLVVADSDWWDSHVDGIAAGATVSIAETGATSVRVQFTPAVW